nr:GAF domain-containing protein [Neobacillus sp. Marseille-Q6967]
MYPNFTCEIYLSAGEHRLNDPSDSLIYLPLKGKEEVYGVLKLNAPETNPLTKIEVDFVTSLAYHAGISLEKDSLLKKSKQVIADLELSLIYHSTIALSKLDWQ